MASTAVMNGKLWGASPSDWADVQEGSARAAFEAVLARGGVEAGVRYLDVGCGSGMATQMAAARGASVSGVDAAEPLLAIARERTPKGDFRVADLETLPFADGAFDFTTGFNAFQYAGEPVKAVREAARVTRRGGTVALVVWGEPAAMQATAMLTALRTLMPSPPPGAAGPFALSETGALRKLATDAGLDPGAAFDVDAVIAYPDVDTAVQGWNSSGVAARAVANSSEEAVTAAHREALAPFAQADGSYRIGARFRCLFGRA